MKDEEPEALSMVERLANTADTLDSLLMLVTGYKAKAMAAGFSEYAAEEMAVHVHQKMFEE